MKRKYAVQFSIGNRLGPIGKYSLKDLCISVVERYSLTDTELNTIVSLEPQAKFSNRDMLVKRL